MRADRVVLDTNVLISALLSPLGKPFRCLTWVLDNGILLSSEGLLHELETRLARPKFLKYVDADKRQQYVAALKEVAITIEVPGLIKVCRDPDDDQLLEIAVLCKAKCVVSGDQDLLVLNPFRDIPVLTPAQFIESVNKVS